MTTAYTSLLGLALPVTGELSGTWGDTVNNSITSLLDTSVAGTTNVSTDTDVTLTTTTGAANTARQAILLFSGARTALRTVTAPAQSKIYTVINATTGGFSVKLVGVGPTTGVTIVAGESAVCAWNGSDFIKISNTGGSASFVNLTASGTVTFTGLTASQAVFTNASDELVSNAITGTGNVVMSASPTLTGTLTASAITASSTITGNGNWVIGNADTDTITQSASYVNGTVLRSAKSATNTLNLAAYDVDGTAYTNLITLTASNTPTLALTSTGVGTINNMSIGATTASTGAFTTLSATGVATFSAGTAAAPAITTTGDTNTGIFFPAADTIGFAEGGSEVMRLDSAGNLGLGVTPNAWNSDLRAFQVGNVGSYFASGTSSFSGSQWTWFGNNGHFNSSSQWIYTRSQSAAQYRQLNNEHAWFNAASGTAGNAITFTQAMTLDASGRLALGSTSILGGTNAASFTNTVSAKSVLAIQNTSTSGYSSVELYNSSGTQTGAMGYGNASVAVTGAQDNLYLYSASAITFLSGGTTERARIDSSGNVGINTSSPGQPLDVNGNIRSRDGGITLSVGTAQQGVFCTYNRIFGSGSDYSPTIFAETGLGITFAVNGSATKAMSIDSSGNLLVGTTGLDGRFRVEVGASNWARVTNHTNSGTQYFDSFRYNGTEIGKITGNNSNVSYVTSSDYRLKDNIQPMTGALATVALLKPCTYTWKIDGALGQGFIAHELQAVVPDAVVGDKDAVNEDGSIKPQGIDTSFLVATLTAALQEAVAEINSLKARLDAANL
jgi:hypothetical protein